jgi:hypothetical protein
LPPAQGRGLTGTEGEGSALSNHPKPPAQSPAHATIRRMETGSRKATHEALVFSERGWSSGFGPLPSKQMRWVRLPHSAPNPISLPTVPPGVGTGLLIRTRCFRAAGRQPIRSHRRSGAALSMSRQHHQFSEPRIGGAPMSGARPDKQFDAGVDRRTPRLSSAGNAGANPVRISNLPLW